MMQFRTRRAPEPEISLTPMIDVLFMVLMFLLLTTTFNQITFMRVALPEATTGQREPQDQAAFRILVEADGALYLDERPISKEDLGRALASVRDKDRADVVVAADERTDHGHVVAVMDLVRRAGISRLSIQTMSRGQPSAPSP